MTPRLLRKINELVEAGATVVGPPPVKSPSLADYPKCDAEVKQTRRRLWGNCDGQTVKEHRYGKGRVIWDRQFQPNADVPAEAKSGLAHARWIWHNQGNPAASAPVGKRYFRRTLTVETNRVIASARVTMTADNAFELWVNGRRAGSGDDFTQYYVMDIASLLRPGANTLAVVADNGGEGPNPAGLIGAVTIQDRDGHALEMITDRQWDSALAASGNWRTNMEGADWGAAQELGPLGMDPWGSMSQSAAAPEHYPAPAATAGVLEGMGVAPDFEADGNLRYIHRRLGDTDLYFVANGGTGWVGADCTFRVSGKVPELWNPLTGRITPPLTYRERAGALPSRSGWSRPARRSWCSVRPALRRFATTRPSCR